MIEKSLDKSLTALVVKAQRRNIFNRLILASLIALTLYFLSLLVSFFLPLSLLQINFIIFLILSALPIALFLDLNYFIFTDALRSVDEKCLLESFVFSSGPVRKILVKKVEQLLKKNDLAGKLRFKLNRLNRLMLIVLISVFGLTQLSGLIRFNSFRLSYQSGTTDTPEVSELTEETGLPTFAQDAESQTQAEQDLANPDGENDAINTNKLSDEELEDALQMFKERLEKKMSSTEGADDPFQEGQENDASAQEPNEDSDFLTTQTEELTEEQLANSKRTSQASDREYNHSPDKGFSDVGESFEESPLIDYTKIKETIQTDKEGEVLKATAKLSEEERLDYLLRYFESFTSLEELFSTYDTDLEQVRSNYLRLIRDEYE